MRLGRSTFRAFTLIELVVVIGIIGLLAALSLPAVSRMIEDSRFADTQTKLRGLLKSAQQRSVTDATTRGLFFFVEDGTQRAVFIEPFPPDTAPLSDGSDSIDTMNNVTIACSESRYRVVEGSKSFAFSKPFRIAPRTVFDQTTPPNPQYIWTDAELANNNYRALTTDNSGPTAGAHNHRNFFTVLFDNGQLLIKDLVLIYDEPSTANAQGALTGLGVADMMNRQDETGFAPDPIGCTLASMIAGQTQSGQSVAANFPSVDGFLVYDDSLFGDFPDETTANEPSKRKFLFDSAQPFYISRQTGAVIVGPRGESEPPDA